jgi:hypothetical protein
VKPGRLIFWIVVLAGALWLFQNRARILASLRPAGDPAAAPAARQDSALSEAAREADKASPGGITDNMTPDQVRSVLGNPDSIETGASDSGKSRERWIYRQAGKAVVFENGVAISVEGP